MLRTIENLPQSVLGVHAEGMVTRRDYETVLVPLLEKERHRGQRLRFLFEFGPEFSGLTVGAAVDDVRLGLRYSSLFEKCAVVTDKDWIRGASQFFGSLMTCPVQTYNNGQTKEAIDWLGREHVDSDLNYELREDGVLIIHPDGPLRREDFDKLAQAIDPWIATHHFLRGVVICIKKFPGWENIGSFIHHIEFVNAHQKKVERVAVVMDGVLPEIMSKIASHFVKAKIKPFPFANTEEAIQWVSRSSNE